MTRTGHARNRGLRFSENILKRLEPNYAKSEEIQIVRNADTSDTSDSSQGLYNTNIQKNKEEIEHEMTDLKPQNPTKNTPLSPYDPSDPSDPSATKPRPRAQATCPKCGMTGSAWDMRIHLQNCEGTLETKNKD